MSVIRIQKNPNRKVRVPETGEELEEKKIYEFDDSVHWRRRIQSGDVIEVSEKEDKAAKKKAKPGPKRKSEDDSEAEEKAEEKKVESDDDKEDKVGEDDKRADDDKEDPNPGEKQESK